MKPTEQELKEMRDFFEKDFTEEEKQLFNSFDLLIQEFVEGNPNKFRKEKLLQEAAMIRQRSNELFAEKLSKKMEQNQ